ncbi:MAG: polyribonucleotide nucleotidyltransferase, partial [Bacteroidetes bacterium]
MMKVIRKTTTLPDGREITLETGALAKQADGAVVLKCGETMLLATVVSSRDIKQDIDFLPLSVDYMERYAATGRFPGGFFKRDGRMGEHEVLISRLIDRALRPLFPDDYHADTQVMVELISSDSKEQPDALACLAASAALIVSDIPFPDPVSEVRVARKNGQYVINPTFQEMEDCDLDLMVAATNDSINMVEGEMKEVSEEVMLGALKVAHDYIRLLNNLQLEMRAEVGKTTREYATLQFDETLYQEIEAIVTPTIKEISEAAVGKEERSERIKAIKTQALEALKGQEKYAEGYEYFGVKFSAYFKEIQKEIVRKTAVTKGLRLDGRGLEDIRPIWCEAGYLPR